MSTNAASPPITPPAMAPADELEGIPGTSVDAGAFVPLVLALATVGAGDRPRSRGVRPIAGKRK